MPNRLVALIVALGLVVAGCRAEETATTTRGPFPDGTIAFTASSNLAVGTERLLVAVAALDGSRLASPEIPITVTVRPDGGNAGPPLGATFMWAIPDHSGLYRVTVDFPDEGTWWIQVAPEGGSPLPEFPVTVHATPSTPGVGTPAPRSDSATSADGPLESISTDTDPDPRFYEMSIAEAVTSGRPSVIVFATPKFCTTAVCGPTLDDIKAMAADHPTVNFVHVEVFTNLDDPENLVYVPAVVEWGLPTEPWVFVVDADGIVVGRFEGVISREELEELLG